MEHRTLKEYKEEVFDKLDEKTKLEWLYEMSEKLCNIEEYIERYLRLNLEAFDTKDLLEKILEMLNKEGE